MVFLCVSQFRGGDFVIGGRSRDPESGDAKALTRAVDICQLTHAHVRFEEADLALQPVFRRPIDTLDFDARRECVAAGIEAVRRNRAELRRLLGPARPPIFQDALSAGGVCEP